MRRFHYVGKHRVNGVIVIGVARGLNPRAFPNPSGINPNVYTNPQQKQELREFGDDEKPEMQ